MDSLSIQPATTTAQTPTAVNPRPVDESAVVKGAVDAKRMVAKATADADAETSAPARDSRSVQYMVQGNRVITTIVDDQSKKVVVQIPDAELIRIAKSIDRMQGFFIEQKA